MGEHQPHRVERAGLVGVGGRVLADEQRQLGRSRRSDGRQHRSDHRGEADELIGADVLAGQQPAPRLGELVGVALQRRHQLPERHRQPADDRRDVVPVVGRRAGGVLDEVDTHQQRRRVERVDDDGVEPWCPDAVARRPGLGTGRADDAPVVERDDERQLGAHGDLDDAVVGVEVDTENLRRRVRRLVAWVEVVDIVEPHAVAQGHDAERQPLFAHTTELVDRHGIEPFAVTGRRRTRHTTLHRESTRGVHPRARSTPRQMNSDEPQRILWDRVRVHGRRICAPTIRDSEIRGDQLTDHEANVARLARERLTNREPARARHRATRTGAARRETWFPMPLRRPSSGSRQLHTQNNSTDRRDSPCTKRLQNGASTRPELTVVRGRQDPHGPPPTVVTKRTY